MPKYRTRRLERFLTEEEFRRLGETLDALEAEGRVPVHAATALRLLMLTGCRRSEIMTLRWEDVHLEANEIRLRDSKTGPRVVPLSPGTARVLAGLPRDAGNPWVIAGRKPGTRFTHIAYYWYRVRERAGLDDVRLHDLRHSCATRSFFEEISSASRRNVPLLSHCNSLMFSIISKLGQPRLIFSCQFA